MIHYFVPRYQLKGYEIDMDDNFMLTIIKDGNVQPEALLINSILQYDIILDEFINKKNVKVGIMAKIDLYIPYLSENMKPESAIYKNYKLITLADGVYSETIMEQEFYFNNSILTFSENLNNSSLDNAPFSEFVKNVEADDIYSNMIGEFKEVKRMLFDSDIDAISNNQDNPIIREISKRISKEVFFM